MPLELKQVRPCPPPLEVLRKVQVVQDLLARAAGYVPAGARALELGCGIGLVVDHLSPALARYTGLDASAEAVAAATAHYGIRAGINFRVADLSAAELSREEPDAVLFLSLTSPPTSDPVGLLRRVRSALSRPGRIIISGSSSNGNVDRLERRILEELEAGGGGEEERPIVERWLKDQRRVAADPSTARSVEGMEALLHHLGYRATLAVDTDLFYGARYLVVAET